MLCISCKPQGSKPKNVFGPDDRKKWEETYERGKFPFHSVGLVYHEDKDNAIIKTCTASLVAPNVILTAAHCAYDDGKNFDTFKYIPHGRSEVQGTFLTSGNSGQVGGGDWALIRLAKAQNDKPFKIAGGGETMAGREVNLAGYSTDLLGLNVHQNCLVTKDDAQTKAVSYDCDMRAGASGGPVYYEENGELFIGAVNSAEKFCDGKKCENGVVYTSYRANLGAKITSDISKSIKAATGAVSSR
jgi:V8-like Glu-specific endopeptidase